MTLENDEEGFPADVTLEQADQLDARADESGLLDKLDAGEEI